MVGDERHHAAAAVLGDALLGEAEEADVEVVEVELLDAPLGDEAFFVRFDKAVFFLGTDAGEGVVGRVAEDDEDGFFLLHLAGGVAFVIETGEGNLFRLFLGRFPAGEGVGQIDPGAFGRVAAVAQRRAEGFEFETKLEMCDNEWRGQNLETEDTLHGRFLEIVRDQGVAALVMQGGGDAAEDGPQVGAGAATRIEDDHFRVCESVREAEFGAEDSVHTFDLVADDLLGGVPDSEFLAQFGIERVQEGLVEVLDGMALVEGLEELSAVHAIQGGGGPVENFDQAQRTETGGVGDLNKKGAEHGHAQEPMGGAPIKASGDGI